MGLSSGRGILARETFDRHQMLRNSEIGLDCSDKARYYAEKLIVGENRTDLIYNILSEKSSHLLCLRRYNEAKIVLEEVYDLMATTYCLDHPLVLKTANLLVKTLIVLKEYYDAQRFASICYEILTRPIDTESDEVADAAYSLARVSFYLIRDQDAERGGEAMERDLKFMEMLLRKAIRIKERINGSHDMGTAEVLIVLVEILQYLDINRNDELEEVMEKMLFIGINDPNGNDILTCFFNNQLAEHHTNIAIDLPHGDARIKRFDLALNYCKEAARINTELPNPQQSDTDDFNNLLLKIMEGLSTEDVDDDFDDVDGGNGYDNDDDGDDNDYDDSNDDNNGGDNDGKDDGDGVTA
eukprot:CAMPEP_0119035960 /NCGR_PEP_ID=MMETSP1177-20130426/3285_1 /TAXON_ID=2985 /ORGANISM="Ochromonas sp, Strain CCMP1899" /LENGTH=354 /DNA_ID=CAMNT_0006994951 /DNA_START=669 /DNA_END=1733 /DNA_ORIENTATION=-